MVSLCGIYLLSSPVTPGPVDIRVGDRYVISLLPVTALSDAPDHGFLVGNYIGHRWRAIFLKRSRYGSRSR